MNTKPLPAVYRIQNIDTGETYIGGTRNAQKRKNHHLSDLRHGTHGNPLIQNAYDLGQKFEFIVLEYFSVGTLDNYILSKEQFWIESLHPTYNRRNALPSIENDRLHRDRSLAERHSHKQTEEEKIKRANSLKQYWKTHEAKPISEEHKRAISEKMSGNKHPLYGKPRDTSTKEKLQYSNSKVEFTFKSPAGELITFRNLRNWCKENNLSESCLRDVRKGNRKQYQGWTFVSAINIPNIGRKKR